MGIHIMIMNTGGHGTAAMRKTTVKHFVINNDLELIFFQEFQWYRQPEDLASAEYEYHGSSTGIMLKRECCHVTNISETILMNSLTAVQHSIVSSSFMGLTGNDFDPVSRMCARIIESDLVEGRFVCISWHGWNNNIQAFGSMTTKRKCKFFRKFIEFLEDLMERLPEQLPFIVAGDSNISRKRVRHVLKNSPFKIRRYISSVRRRNKVIDYALVTEGLNLNHLRVLQDDIPEHGGNVLIFDHDPLEGVLEVD